jgi:8-oxo-dGTP diphosphatase
MVFDRASPQFHGVMPYKNGRPVSWSYSTVAAAMSGLRTRA